MSGDRKMDTDDDLSSLLDSALADFGKTKNTDSEVDKMMAELDAKAVEKAAKYFDEVLSGNLKGCGASTSDATTFSDMKKDASASLNQDYLADPEERKAAENFQNMMKALIQAEEKSRQSQKIEADANEVDKALSDELFHKLKTLVDLEPAEFLDGSSWLMMKDFAKTIFAKDFMYPTVQQIRTKFLEYMAENPNLSEEKRHNYEKQIDVLTRICKAYEEEPSEGNEFSLSVADEICSLVTELQTYGYPPEEVVGSIPPGWSVDQASGLPHVDDISKAADACCLM